jgi:hypothetical protein
MGCVGAGCAGSMGGWTGLRVCPETFITTIMLMVVSNSSIRTLLLFINFPVGCRLCSMAANLFCHSVFRLTNYKSGRSIAMGCNPTAIRSLVQRD